MIEKTKECIIVLGMHRSGTSVLAGCIERAGYFIGKTPMPSTEDNPLGYYENIKIWQLNEKLLSLVGAKWDTTARLKFDLDYFQHKLYKKEIRKIIAEDFLNNDFILIKDPRISLLFNLWKEVIEEVGYRLKVILCVRKPEEVCFSLVNRDNFSYEKSGLMYSLHYVEALFNIRKLNYGIIQYDQLLQDPLNCLTQLYSKLGVNVFTGDREYLESINSFIKPSLNKSKNILNQGLLPGIVNEVYSNICRAPNVSEIELKELIHKHEVSISNKSFKDDLLDHAVQYLEISDHDERREIELERTFISLSNSLETVISKIDQYESILIDTSKAHLDSQYAKIIHLKDVVINTAKDQLERHFTKQEILNTNVINLIEKDRGMTEELENLRIEIAENLKEKICNEKEKFKLDKKIENLETTIEVLKMKYERQLGLEQKNIDDLLVEKKEFLEEIGSLKNSEKRLNYDKSIIENRFSDLERVYTELKNSKSNKLGFFLTWPFRKLMDDMFIFNWKVILKFVQLSFENPRMILKSMNKDNYVKLKTALKYEEPRNVISNLDKFYKGLSNIEETKQSLVDSTFIYNIDEGGRLKDIVVVRGWVVSKEEISAVLYRFSDGEWQEAIYGRQRPDIAIVFSSYPKAQFSEFYIRTVIVEDFDNIELQFVSGKGHVKSLDYQLGDFSDFSVLSLNDQYKEYLNKKYQVGKFKSSAIQDSIDLEFSPMISIVVPVYNTEPKWLNECVESVLNQTYKNWELILYDDASTKENTRKYLHGIQHLDERIRVYFGETNMHISMATNEAIKYVEGEFVGLLDHDDTLTMDALMEVVILLNSFPEADLMYSDEDKLELDGQLVEPHFKPDFGIDSLRSNNYMSHFGVIRRSLGNKVGWFREGYEGSQDHDLYLRLIDETSSEKILHIPKILYHWRKVPGSTAVEYDSKGYASNAGKLALEDHLERNNLKGTVEDGLWPGCFRIQYDIIEEKKISIIIPFRDMVDMLRNCIESIFEHTKYDNYEIILVNNDSVLPETLSYLRKIQTRERIRVLHYKGEFNFSSINNYAVQEAKGDLILLLNNDIKVIANSWLRIMAGYFEREEIGAVGVKLLYDDFTIQHAGVVIGMGGIAGHVQKHLENTAYGYFAKHLTVHNVSAVTAACLMTTKKLYQSVGGLDEENLKVAFNDVDFCLKIRDTGKLIVYTPFVELIHYESKSRGLEDTKEKRDRFLAEVEFFRNKWKNVLDKGDPYFNPNFTLSREDYSLNLD